MSTPIAPRMQALSTAGTARLRGPSGGTPNSEPDPKKQETTSHGEVARSGASRRQARTIAESLWRAARPRCRSGLHALSLVLDPYDACRRSEDAPTPIVPPDAKARRILGENLLDDARSTRVSGSFRFENDPVLHARVDGSALPAIRSRQQKASAARPS
jgi:hypothetical protein